MARPLSKHDEPRCSPFAAAEWLASWKKIAGGVTVGADGIVHAWRLADREDPDAETAAALLDRSLTVPGLNRAIRAVRRTQAISKVRP